MIHMLLSISPFVKRQKKTNHTSDQVSALASFGCPRQFQNPDSDRWTALTSPSHLNSLLQGCTLQTNNDWWFLHHAAKDHKLNFSSLILQP